MYTTTITWTSKSIEYSLGESKFLTLTIRDRHGYDNRKTPRNLAVYISMTPFFSNYLSSMGQSLYWKDAFEILRKLGATDDEINRFAQMGYDMGWGDIEDVGVRHGQSTMALGV